MNAALRDQLLRTLDEGSTGCLAVSARGGLLQLFVMDGNIIAAHSPEDDILLLRRVVVTGLISRVQASEMMHRTEEIAVADQLYDHLDEDTTSALLFDRFKENLGLWLRGAAPADFQAMDGIFLSNLHLSHNSRDLLDEVQDMLERTSGLRTPEGLRAAVRPGPSPALTPQAETLLGLVDSGRTISEILRASPFEELTTLDQLARMLLDSSLEWWLNLEADEDTVVEDRPDSLSTAQVSAEPEELEPDLDEPESEESAFDAPSSPALAELPATPEETEIRPDPGASATNRLSIEGFHAGPDHEVADVELGLFADSDMVSSGQGDYIRTAAENEAESFVLHNSPIGDASLSDAIVADEVPEVETMASGARVRFSGPMLSDTEARQKIDISNAVLRLMAEAFDRQMGAGSGRSQIQLLFEGSPTEFKDLFVNIECNEDGSATPARLLANLRTRPHTEHRRLLNRALADLVMRGMDLASEHLSDENIEDVAMAAASVEQRLGL